MMKGTGQFWQGPLSAKQCMPETLSSFSEANRLRVDEPRRQHRPAKSSGDREGSAARRGNLGVGVRVRGASVAQAAFLPQRRVDAMSAPRRNVLSFAHTTSSLPTPSPRKSAAIHARDDPLSIANCGNYGIDPLGHGFRMLNHVAL